jgi:dipeptidyl aminopeptidase/acylaminoacyl peptidase
LDIDYRGSDGYGRDFRTAIYRFMGGKDLTDQIDGIWSNNLGIDAGRVGLYGGSYGGFITLMAMLTTPNEFVSGALCVL